MADECRQVLIARNLRQLTRSSDLRIALHTLMTREVYNRLDVDAQAFMQGMYGGFDGYQEHRTRELQEHDYRLSLEEAYSLVTLQASDGATEAWAQCMNRKMKYGLLGYLKPGSTKDTKFLATLEWRAPTVAVDRTLRNVQVEFRENKNLKKLASDKRLDKPGFNESAESRGLLTDVPTEITEGKTSFFISRKSNRHSVIGFVNAQLQDSNGDARESFTWSFYIPSFEGLQPSPYPVGQPDIIGKPQNVLNGLHFDTTSAKNPAGIKIGNQENLRGLSVHTISGKNSIVRIRIPTGAKMFKTRFGISDHFKGDQSRAHQRGQVFSRWSDGRVKHWQEDVRGMAFARTRCHLPIHREMQYIELQSKGITDNWGGWTAWVDPHFV